MDDMGSVALDVSAECGRRRARIRSARAFSPGPVWAGGVGVASEKEGGGEGSRVWKAKTSILYFAIGLALLLVRLERDTHLITPRLQISLILE
jgi:hypothetical protein